MSNTSQSSTDSKSERSENDRLSFGLLREIRTDAQYLQNLFEETIGLAEKLDAAGRAALMDRVLSDRMQARIDFPISRNLDVFAALFAVDNRQREWGSDAIESIRLNWLHVMDLWPNAALTSDEQRQAIAQAQVCLDQIIYQCASLTLSPRVNDTMENLRVGQPLDFDFVFSGELPRNLEMRSRLLQELSQEGGVLGSAVVDCDQRVIYKVAQTRAEQRHSAYKIVALLVLAGAIVPLALEWAGTLTNNSPFNWPDLPRLYMLYVVVFLGAGAHVAIDALKAAKAQTRPDFQAMNDWVLWVHVRYISILWTLGWIVLGYILLVLAMPKLELASAFFAGYSIDSITGLFLARFETTVKTNTQALTGVKSTP